MQAASRWSGPPTPSGELAGVTLFFLEITLYLTPKNWHNFQHYSLRNPPWIKLHYSLLDDRQFQQLPIASKALAPMLWLLASEYKDGVFCGAAEELAFRLRWPEPEIAQALTPLIDNGFFIPVNIDASTLLARRKQSARPETETETKLTSPCIKGKGRKKKPAASAMYPGGRT